VRQIRGFEKPTKGDPMNTYMLGTTRIAGLPADGPLLSTEQDALDIIGDSYGLEADFIAIPVSRLAPDFFRLRTGLAGAFIQKLVNYGLRVAFVGDISAEVAASDALRDFVYESNKGSQVLFAIDAADLARRLA
jgi:hypothetical protein